MASVRAEHPGDEAGIRLVNEPAFGQKTEADLVDALRARDKLIVSLVAEHEGRIVGHIAFSRVTIDSEGRVLTGAGLAPMAVLPEMQGRGIGSMLVRDGLDRCREKAVDFVVVLGYPSYYPRFGFARASSFGIHCEYEAPDAAFMAIELRAGALVRAAGTARFEPEFKEA